MAGRPTSGTCKYCGEQFGIKPVGRVREVCSKSCGDKAYRERNNDKVAAYHAEYRRNNAEKISESLRSWREANSEALAAKKKAHYEENIDHYREYKRKYHADNAERLCAKTVQWQKDNPDKANMRNQRRRSRVRGAFVEDVNPYTVLDRDNWVCHICDTSIDPSIKSPDKMSWSVDHVVPLAKGGTHEYENCKAAHRGCNSRKGAKLDYQFDGGKLPSCKGA